MGTDAIIQEVRNIVTEELGTDFTVKLIGSRSRASARAGSDYDFLILGPTVISVLTLAKIRDKLDDLPTLAKIDVVDALRASKTFLDVALT